MAAGYCKDCFTGTLRGDAKPTGTVETVCGLPAYVARPDPGQQALGIVVILPDAFGWELLNTRALADAYARRGPFLVYLPDFQAGAGSSPLSCTAHAHVPTYLLYLAMSFYRYPSNRRTKTRKEI